ncbi:hypothetical protein GCM10009096_24520 [Parasphingorhabdus litoris]|uniref:Uncharacterized protein n=1 Tax=Parasphingorhabdus litoris TaxID=394733 RepID=A0ABN1APU0_9SPHN
MIALDKMLFSVEHSIETTNVGHLRQMRIVLLDGHPDDGRYSSHLLQVYENALPSDAIVEKVAVRDMQFSPVF